MRRSADARRGLGADARPVGLPRSLRLAPLAALAAATLLLPLAPATAAQQRREPASRALAAASAFERDVVAELNAVRREHGLAPLRASAPLAAAAEHHAETMAREGFFAHESADGSPFWKRVQRFYGKAGYRSWAVGENLLWASPDVDPQRAVRMWMRSSGHRANILSAAWREVGVAAVHVARAPGVFGEREVTTVAADFGARA
jgi:uncharacterized protein YkwD